MKQLNVYDTLIQNEALINELKGNLFEFLVGKELATAHHLEGQYLNAIPRDFFDRLQGYEHWLREHSAELLSSLPALANDTAKVLVKNLPGDLEGVLVVGKLAGGNHDRRAAEADLLVKSKGEVFPLSLKLCKEKSFVNTKSAGVRSFFSRYFGESFPKTIRIQGELNSQLDVFYRKLSRKLHEMAGLKPEDQFSNSWREAGLAELPGQLNSEMNSVLKDHYHEMILLFYAVWKELLAQDPQQFYDCMMPLLGFGNRELSQISCFYKGKYEFSYSSFKQSEPYRSALMDSKLIAPKDGLSSFEMQMEGSTFQVRLKPMNKFTVSGLKVNCSLKQLKSC